MNIDYKKTNFTGSVDTNYHVLVIEDDSSRRTIILEEPNYSVGRDTRNTIMVSSKKVSRFHATLLRRTDTKNQTFSYWLLDGDLQGNRSTNGVFINDKRCLVQELKHEDVLRFGFEVHATYYVISNPADLALLQSGDFQKSSEGERTNATVAPQKVERQKLDKKSQQTLVISEANVESDEGNDFQNSEIAKLASFPELSPNPIIELDWVGNITYLNPSAVSKFPELKDNSSLKNHPLLLGLLKNTNLQSGDNKLFVREVNIKNLIFEQYIHYLPDKKLIRSYIFDFTKRKALESQLQETEERYKAFINQTKEGVFLVDAQNKKILEVNNALADILGYSLEELYSLKLYDLVDLTTTELDTEVEQILKAPKEENKVKTLHYKSKKKTIVELESSIIWTSYGDQTILSFSVRPLRREVSPDSLVSQPGIYDLETGLPNRQLFLEQLNTAIANSHRNKGLLSIIFVELEILANSKETLGYRLKSGILDGFAKRLRASLRSGDTIAYWEDSQFVCLLPQVRNFKDVGRVCNRMLESLKPPFFIDDHKVYTKVSIGVAIKERSHKSSELLLTEVQNALQMSKDSGSSNYRFFDQPLQLEIERVLRIEKLLTYALERQEFFLYYQPQVETSLKSITGIEALIRWNHPELGVITPEQFIPLAEETGLIVTIGEWVIETACHQRQLWMNNGLKDQPICVNISPQQLKQPNFIQTIKNILAKTGLNSYLLELEIKETFISEDTDFALKTLRELNELGIRIALDDFGSGASALGYLKQFPFNTLKIDRPVVDNILNNIQEKAMVGAIITISNSLDSLRVVAEGVEEKAIMDQLIQLGCQEIQGNWLTKPLDSGKMTQFLNEAS